MAGAGGKITEYDYSAVPGQSGKLGKLSDYPYAGEWKWDPATNRPIMGSKEEVKSVGTTIEVTPIKLPNGLIQLSWSMRHFYAAPELHA